MKQPLKITYEMLKNLTIDKAKQLLNKDIYSIEKQENTFEFGCNDSYIIHSNKCYSLNDDSKYPYKKIDYANLYLSPASMSKDNSFEYYNEKINDCKQYVTVLTEKEFLHNIKLELENTLALSMNKTKDSTPKGEYFDIEEKDLINIFGYNSENVYEVAFVVCGYIEKEDDCIGDIECNGATKGNDENFHLKDGRAYFSVVANSPEEAYWKAIDLFDDMDVGDCTIVDSKLEHISQSFENGADKYWYEEDLDFGIER